MGKRHAVSGTKAEEGRPMLPLPLQFLAAWRAVWLGRVLQRQIDTSRRRIDFGTRTVAIAGIGRDPGGQRMAQMARYLVDAENAFTKSAPQLPPAVNEPPWTLPDSISREIVRFQPVTGTWWTPLEVFFVGTVGIEPTTNGLRVRCSAN